MSELRIERSYAIDAESLFALVTAPENLQQWWGPEGMTATDASLNLTQPGPWWLKLTGPRGSFEMRGVVIGVDPPRSVEFTMNVPGQDAPDSTVRFEVDPDGRGGSRFSLIQLGITDEMVDMGRRGWKSTLDRLDRLVAGAGAA